MKEYTLEHFRFGDIHQPYLVEHYNAETGEMLSDEADYNHSFYLDLIVRHICGIEPTDAGMRFEPLDTGLEYFSIRGVNVKGHSVDVYYQRRAGHYDGQDAGYMLLIDGEARCSAREAAACRFEIELADV